MNRFLARGRWLVLAAALSLVAMAAVACGDDDDSGEAATTSSATTTTTAAATSTSSTAAPSSTAEAGPRTITTAFGDVEVPADVERVVALSEIGLDVSIALGIKPVGAVATRLSTDVADYIKDEAGNVAIVGTVGEPNLEAVIAADPDLIIAPTYYEKAVWEQLTAIAPTIVPANIALGDWRAEGRVIAEALGKSTEFQDVVAEFDTRVAEVGATVDPSSAVAIRWLPQGPQVLNVALLPGPIFEKLGIAQPEIARTISGPHSDPLSLEALSEIDSDWIFIATLNKEGDTAVAEAQSQPAFQRLPAAQAGQMVAVDGHTWSSAFGPLAAHAVLDDIEAALGN
jgi:iron complex transport system substrate-binding protein